VGLLPEILNMPLINYELSSTLRRDFRHAACPSVTMAACTRPAFSKLIINDFVLFEHVHI